MSRRKANGRITVEEVSEIFRRPLDLLVRVAPPAPPAPPPGSGDEPPLNGVGPPSATETVGYTDPLCPDHGPVPLASEVAPPPTIPRLRRKRVLGTPTQPKPATSPTDGARQQPASPAPRGTSEDTVNLVAQLEDNLLEAACLAAELQRRYQETLAEHHRVSSQLRELIEVLADQLRA